MKNFAVSHEDLCCLDHWTNNSKQNPQTSCLLWSLKGTTATRTKQNCTGEMPTKHQGHSSSNQVETLAETNRTLCCVVLRAIWKLLRLPTTDKKCRFSTSILQANNMAANKMQRLPTPESSCPASCWLKLLVSGRRQIECEMYLIVLPLTFASLSLFRLSHC